jgi:low affinity Fe/Cu permease
VLEIIGRLFELVSSRAARIAGSSAGFGAAIALVVGWFLAGPLMGYSEGWQMSINTVTTVITFLMVFLIQRAQNKDAQALHIKLSELIASQAGASNQLLHVEEKTEKELEELKELQRQLPQNTSEAHSIGSVAQNVFVRSGQETENFDVS